MYIAVATQRRRGGHCWKSVLPTKGFYQPWEISSVLLHDFFCVLLSPDNCSSHSLCVYAASYFAAGRICPSSSKDQTSLLLEGLFPFLPLLLHCCRQIFWLTLGLSRMYGLQLFRKNRCVQERPETGDVDILDIWLQCWSASLHLITVSSMDSFSMICNWMHAKGLDPASNFKTRGGGGRRRGGGEDGGFQSFSVQQNSSQPWFAIQMKQLLAVCCKYGNVCLGILWD